MSQEQNTAATMQSPLPKEDWRAFVNMMPSPDRERLLMVTGTIYVESNKPGYRLVAAEPQGINPRILILEVQPEFVRGEEAVELRYEQAVSGPDQYSSITIRIAGREDVEITEIGSAH